MGDSIINDRNFDDLIEKFSRKVYAGLKGDIRLAVIRRDLLTILPNLNTSKRLRVLDIGGGLGQISLWLAAMGHEVTYNDMSRKMLEAAQESATDRGLIESIHWYQCPYQSLSRDELGTFDIVLCHALIEWLAKPEDLLRVLSQFTAESGVLSLTFYNQKALVYRNLIRGNFKVLENDFVADPGSLTPHTPFEPKQIDDWISYLPLKKLKSSGIRVFHDYVMTKRGGHNDDKAMIETELKYSEIEPYKWLGRYIHLLLLKN